MEWVTKKTIPEWVTATEAAFRGNAERLLISGRLAIYEGQRGLIVFKEGRPKGCVYDGPLDDEMVSIPVYGIDGLSLDDLVERADYVNRWYLPKRFHPAVAEAGR